MSWQATIWVAELPHSRVAHVPFRVLMLLADHAHSDGTSAWYHIDTLAGKLEVSQRTIYRALKELKDQGLIREGDQRLVSHIPENKRPKVYDLNLSDTAKTRLTDLSPLTTDGKHSKEEPPFKTNKDLEAGHTVSVTPDDQEQGQTDGYAAGSSPHIGSADLLDVDECYRVYGHSRGVGLMANTCRRCHSDIPTLTRS